MRIKRQRRKLRGKYSGNCLSCSAKWSKCWYIASIDNQREWENRLSKTVTPCTDEVCFQCWDAKIRTSPKRKIHFKTELSVVNDSASAGVSAPLGTRYAKRVDRNKRRAMNGDFDYTIHASEFSTKRSDYDAKPAFGDYETDELYEDEDLYDDESPIDSTRVYEESVIFDEENAVILLSTAFRTIPDVNIAININSYHDMDDDEKTKRRGAYYCGKCGKLKKGHVCDEPHTVPNPEGSPNTPLSTAQPLSSISIQVSTISQLPIQSTAVDVTLPAVGAFAQPVVS